jgi:hypothetical protein
MGKLNNIIRFVVLHINFCFSLLGIIVLGLGLYACIADWGTLDEAFFLGGGIIASLVGVLLVQLAFLGCFGVSYQHRKTGPWTGRRVLGAYEVALVCCLVGAIYMALYLFAAIATFNSTYNDLQANTADDDEVVVFETMEEVLARKFNDFFFGASYGTCGDLKYQWFWSLVNDECPDSISQSNCQKCAEYSITMCEADRIVCDATADQFGPACPYNACRKELLEYISDIATPISYTILAFVIFQLIFLVLACMLICYTERDSLEKQMIKAGTISEAKRQALRKGSDLEKKAKAEKMKAKEPEEKKE